MKKFQVLLLALMAVFAFSAIVAGSASAEITLLAEWLFNGAILTSLLPVTTTGTLLFSTLVLGVKAVEIECSGSFDGSVGPNGEDEVTEVLDAAGVAVGQNLVGHAISCTVLVGAGGSNCDPGELAELWVDNLPWLTQLELMESGAILDVFLGEPGYHVFCTVLGGENLCTGLTSTTMTNGATDVLGAFDATSEKATCTLGGAGAGDIIGEGLTFEEPGVLSVSSE
jgi:hypothetical protein